MKTTNIIINNFEDLHKVTQNNPLHVITGTEGFETLFPETEVNLDALLDLPLPENFDFCPYSLHIYQTPDQFLQDIEHNIEITDFTNLGGDDSFYDYIPNRISCIIQGFETLALLFPDKINQLLTDFKTRLLDAEDDQDVDYGIEYIDTFLPQLNTLSTISSTLKYRN